MQPAQDKDRTRVMEWEGEALAVALELSGKSWKIGIHGGGRDRPALYGLEDESAAARLGHLQQMVAAYQRKWSLPASLPVMAIYEAGQEGFWISRALGQAGWSVLVVDPASIPVERQARRAKTDRLDALRLLTCLKRWLAGERGTLRIVHEPDPQAEAHRHLVRERGQLQKEMGQHTDRIRKLLRTMGCWVRGGKDMVTRIRQGQMRCHDGRPLPPALQSRLLRECERLELAQEQLAALEASLLTQLPAPVRERIAQLQRLKAVGPTGATRLVLELYWRDFDNRRQVGACVGLVPQPYDSGQSRVDQGISKQGNRRVRALLLEMAWMWLRYQPHSALSTWFAQQCAGSGKRSRRIAIVAVARRLAIALWRYLKQGELPAGAQLKAA